MLVGLIHVLEMNNLLDVVLGHGLKIVDVIITCVYAYWIGDGICDHPDVSGFDDDLTCYGNDGGDCPDQLFCGPPNDCTGQGNEGNCYCDDQCKENGNCCPDYSTYCE